MQGFYLVNGVEAAGIDPADRGLAYGDGVFRTLRLRNGAPLEWPWQYRRLARDCAALGIKCPGEEVLREELHRLAARLSDGVGKIVVTRGPGARGYGPHLAGAPTRIVSVGPLPGYPASYGEAGVRVRVCALRLAYQPRLAGIKHLNRLENVLARGEWQDATVQEGLLLDGAGRVVEGTMSNLFCVLHGRLVTPALSRCGVEGVQRDRVMAFARSAGIALEVRDLTLDELFAAEEAFLVNSVIRLWPIAALERRTWEPGALTRRIQAEVFADG